MRLTRCCALGLFFAAMAAAWTAQSAFAQVNCSLGRVVERTAPQYPMQLDQRVVEGQVGVLVTFNPDGRVSSTKSIAGPQALRFESESYVRGWRAEPSSDIRQCTVTLDYRFEGAPNTCSTHNEIHIRAERLDDNHVLMHMSCGGW